MTFTVTGEQGGVTVAYTISGTATGGSTEPDYTDPGLGPLTVTIPAGQTTQTIVISTTSDTRDEVFESVTITLTGVVSGSGVIDGARNTATAMIVDRIQVWSVDDDKSTTPIPIVTSEATSTVLLWVDADGTGVLDRNDYDRRAYVLNVEVRRTVDSRWVPGKITSAYTKDAGANTHTTLLPNFADLGYGQIVWVEGSNPPNDRYLLLEITSANRSHDRYRISIAKPDFAIISRPALSDPGPKGRDSGNVTLTVTIRNSAKSDYGDRDRENSVDAYCKNGVWPLTESTSFEYLRGSGSSALVQSQVKRPGGGLHSLRRRQLR